MPRIHGSARGLAARAARPARVVRRVAEEFARLSRDDLPIGLATRAMGAWEAALRPQSGKRVFRRNGQVDHFRGGAGGPPDRDRRRSTMRRSRRRVGRAAPTSGRSPCCTSRPDSTAYPARPTKPNAAYCWRSRRSAWGSRPRSIHRGRPRARRSSGCNCRRGRASSRATPPAKFQRRRTDAGPRPSARPSPTAIPGIRIAADQIDVQALEIGGGIDFAGDRQVGKSSMCRENSASTRGLDQFFVRRPFASSVNHRTHVPGLRHIGASTHPGPGLGGGSGFSLASALK